MGYYCIFKTAFSYCWKLIDFYIVKWAILTSLAFLYAFKPKYILVYRFNKMSPFPMLGVFDSIYNFLFQYFYRTFYKQKLKRLFRRRVLDLYCLIMSHENDTRLIPFIVDIYVIASVVYILQSN